MFVERLDDFDMYNYTRRSSITVLHLRKLSQAKLKPTSLQITNKDLLYSTGNSAQYLCNNLNGKCIHYSKMNHFAIYLKLSQHC